MKKNGIEKNILIVEDDRNIGNLIKEIVERKGNIATLVGDGEEGFKAFSNIKFDLVITDIKMPKLDGISLIKLIREKDKNIPIIIITGYGSDENIAAAKKYGVEKFLKKPCSVLEISKAIDDSLKTGYKFKT